ncbi:MAG: hypothetical protein QXQ79_00240 [Candidatus Nanoarchaeia archaeon]
MAEQNSEELNFDKLIQEIDKTLEEDEKNSEEFKKRNKQNESIKNISLHSSNMVNEQETIEKKINPDDSNQNWFEILKNIYNKYAALEKQIKETSDKLNMQISEIKNNLGEQYKNLENQVRSQEGKMNSLSERIDFLDDLISSTSTKSSQESQLSAPDESTEGISGPTEEAPQIPLPPLPEPKSTEGTPLPSQSEPTKEYSQAPQTPPERKPIYAIKKAAGWDEDWYIIYDTNKDKVDPSIYLVGVETVHENLKNLEGIDVYIKSGLFKKVKVPNDQKRIELIGVLKNYLGLPSQQSPPQQPPSQQQQSSSQSSQQ